MDLRKEKIIRHIVPVSRVKYYPKEGRRQTTTLLSLLSSFPLAMTPFFKVSLYRIDRVLCILAELFKRIIRIV